MVRAACGLALLAVLANLGLGGCSFYVTSAESAYQEGRYLEAEEELAEREHEIPALTPPQQARYGVYRGMALLRLGDYESAHRWLRYTKMLEDKKPTLTPVQRRLFDGGMTELRSRGLRDDALLRPRPGLPAAPKKSAPGAPLMPLPSLQ